MGRMRNLQRALADCGGGTQTAAMITPDMPSRPPLLHFASDNAMGASPQVMAAIIQANEGAAPAYGHDAWTARVEAAMSLLFEREVAVSLLATGTGANALALAAVTRPWALS